MNQLRNTFLLLAGLPLARAVTRVAACLLLSLIFFTGAAQATELRCSGGEHAPGANKNALTDYMCSVVRAQPNAKLYFAFGGPSGATVGNFDDYGRGTQDNDYKDFSASMTKIVTVFMMMEVLAKNEGRGSGLTQNYRTNRWNLDTKVRIVNEIPAGYNPDTSPGDIIYVGSGFASSKCNNPNGWDIVHLAQLALYNPQQRMNNEYTIRQLISHAMAVSYNDVALLLGALVANRLGIDSLTVNNGLGGHQTWVTQFRSFMNSTARGLGAPDSPSFCSPAGWNNTLSGGCSNQASVRDWAAIARNAYRKIANLVTSGNMHLLFAQLYAAPITTQVSGSDRVPRCSIVTREMTANTARSLLAGTGTGVDGPVRLVKTGTTTVRNLVALAEPRAQANDQCYGQSMVAVVMGLGDVGSAARDAVVGNMFAAGRAVGTGNRCQMAYNGNAALAESQTSIQPSRTPLEQAAAEDYFVTDDTQLADIMLSVLPPPDEGPVDDGTGVGPGSPSGNISANNGEEECAEEFDLAQQWGEELKISTGLNVIDEMFNSRVDEIFGQQCIGKLVSMMQQISGALNTVRTIVTSADMMGAIVGAAVGAIVYAIMDQIFNSLTNMICNVTRAITSAIDNVSRNLLCFDRPLFSIPNDPFRIPIEIEDLSCSGIAINPLYFSNDPRDANQSLVAGGRVGGSAGGEITRGLSQMRAGDRPFWCPPGQKAVRANAPGNGAHSSMGLNWTCEADPSYRPRQRPGDDQPQRRSCFTGPGNRCAGTITPDSDTCVPIDPACAETRPGPR